MDAEERVQLSKDLLDSRLSYTRKNFNLGYEMLKAQYDAKTLTRSEFDAAVEEMIDRNTDWFDLLFRNAVTQNHTVSLSGGNESTTYYSSVGASIAQGTARQEVSKRYTAILKLNSWLSSKVYLGFQLNGSITDNQGYHSSFNPDSYARETARTIRLITTMDHYFSINLTRRSLRVIWLMRLMRSMPYMKLRLPEIMPTWEASPVW